MNVISDVLAYLAGGFVLWGGTSAAQSAFRQYRQQTARTSKVTRPVLDAAQIEKLRAEQKLQRLETRAQYRIELEETIGQAVESALEETERARKEGRLVVSPASAERAMEIAMARFLGLKKSRRTPPGPDRGIDIEAPNALAQVKYYPSGAKVGRPDIQRLVGATRNRRAEVANLKVIFFAFGENPYSKVAIEEADQSDVALFTFNNAGSIFPANSVASELKLIDSQANERAQKVWELREEHRKEMAGPPKVGSKCICGGKFVLRKRHSDGRKFLGCSSYPSCTETRRYDR